MTMPDGYNPNVPLADWTYSQWQPAFLNNFQQLYNAFAANHEPLDAVSNAGNHTNVQLYDQKMPPNVVVSELGVFSQLVPNQVDQLHMKYQDNKTVFQWTNYQIYPIEVTTAQTAYFTSIPGGLMVYFGTFLYNKGSKEILLQPTIAKNLLSICVTNLATSSLNDTKYPAIAPVIEEGIINKLTITPQGPAFSPGVFYLVVANI